MLYDLSWKEEPDLKLAIETVDSIFSTAGSFLELQNKLNALLKDIGSEVQVIFKSMSYVEHFYSINLQLFHSKITQELPWQNWLVQQYIFKEYFNLGDYQVKFPSTDLFGEEVKNYLGYLCCRISLHKLKYIQSEIQQIKLGISKENTTGVSLESALGIKSS